MVNVVNETADVGAPRWPDSPHRRPAIAGCLPSGRRADSRSSHPRLRLRRDCSLMRQVRMVAPSSPTDGCVEAAGAGPRARRLVHRQPHTTTCGFREGHPVDVAVVASVVLCRHTTTSIAAALAGWRASSVPQGVADGDRDAGQDFTQVQDGGLGAQARPERHRCRESKLVESVVDPCRRNLAGTTAARRRESATR